MTPTWSKDEIDVLRNRPLEKVAAALDYRPDPSDRTRWKRDGSVLCISGTKFFDHLQGRGGGGAIDLVMHARKCPFLEAVNFLAQSQGRPPAISEPSQAWSKVRSWLIRQRALPTNLVDTCHAHNLIGAGRHNNAVFVCTDRHRKITGAELVGTFTPPGHKPFRAMAPGSRKARGSFWLATDPEVIKNVILTEGAIDALSIHALDIAQCRKPGTLIASTSGVTVKLPDWIRCLNPQRILCAWDADTIGDEAARHLQNSEENVQRRHPDGAKDWNDILKIRA